MDDFFEVEVWVGLIDCGEGMGVGGIERWCDAVKEHGIGSDVWAVEEGTVGNEKERDGGLGSEESNDVTEAAV